MKFSGLFEQEISNISEKFCCSNLVWNVSNLVKKTFKHCRITPSPYFLDKLRGAGQGPIWNPIKLFIASCREFNSASDHVKKFWKKVHVNVVIWEKQGKIVGKIGQFYDD